MKRDRALDALHEKAPNYDVSATEMFTPENGWEIDDYCEPLPPERPGPPVSGGSWKIAQRLMRDYEFADPDIVRALYRPDDPLENRDMLLELRIFGLTVRVGVRVAAVRDETSEIEGRPVRIWGWSYRTLQGHLEMGQMDYAVWKWIDSGEVEFRIHRFSRPASIPNPIVRLGFRLFGRRKQVEFAQRACERMAALTNAELRGEEPPVARTADELAARA